MAETIADLEDYLNAALRRLEAAQTDCADAKAALEAARIAAGPIQVGDQVRPTGPGIIARVGKQTMRVTQVLPMPGKPWVVAVARKKGGDWGTAPRHLYADWEKIA